MFLGENLLPFLVLAIGGAMCIGTLLALFRPPETPRGDGDLERAPIGRSIVFILVGAVAAVWALASLLNG